MSTNATAATKTQLLIGGTWRDASDGVVYDDANPATGARLAGVAEATRADADAAVSAARKAFDTGKWPTMAASRRAKIVYKIAQLIAERAKELALLEVRDNGKTISTAKGELGAIVNCFEFYAGAATKNYGLSMPPPLPTYLASTVREPVGVVGAIVPWNFPLLLAAWKVAPALAAGCTIVLKPAPLTPLTAINSERSRSRRAFPRSLQRRYWIRTRSRRVAGGSSRASTRSPLPGSTQTGKVGCCLRRPRRSSA